jgi:hypothetical protein
MLTELLPFQLHLDPTAIAGATLWSLAFYLGCSGLTEWITNKLTAWFNFAERSLYTSQTEFEETRKGRESQNAFFASLFSIVPFLLVGSLCNWGVDLSLGRSWSISIGLLACMSCGIYELGRRQG